MASKKEIRKAIRSRSKTKSSSKSSLSPPWIIWIALIGVIVSIAVLKLFNSSISSTFSITSFLNFLHTMNNSEKMNAACTKNDEAGACSNRADVQDSSAVQERLLISSKCALGEICNDNQTRPLLSDGRISQAVWDRSRYLMKTNFARDSGKVSYVWKEPLVVYYDDVLSEDDISYLIETATPRFQRSRVAGPDGKPIPDSTRTSDTAWILMSEGDKVQSIAGRVSALAGFDKGHAEDIGINRYQRSQYFKPHFDYMQEDQLAYDKRFENCQRAATALIYLSDVEEGGETIFIRSRNSPNYDYDPNNPDHLAVKPKRGRVLIWYDMHPFTETIDDRTLHAGSPVVIGTKIAATIFLRNCTRAVKTN